MNRSVKLSLPPVFAGPYLPPANHSERTLPVPPIGPSWCVPPALRSMHFPELVQSWWTRIAEIVRVPATERVIDGHRVMRVLGNAHFIFAANGAIKVRLWALHGGEMVWEEIPGKQILLSGAPCKWVWLRNTSDACTVELMDRLAGKGGWNPDDLHRYIQCIFGQIRNGLIRHFDLTGMRRRLAQALDLDADAVRLARALIVWLPDHGTRSRNDVRVAEYNHALQFKEQFLKLERECPVLLPLYGAMVAAGHGADDPEPVRAVRQYLQSKKISGKTWRLLVKAGTRFFLPVRTFYKGDPANAMVDYLQLVQALGVPVEPDATLVWYVLARYANSGNRRRSYMAPAPAAINRYAQVAQAYMAMPDRQQHRHKLEAVLEWIAVAGSRTDKPQRRAGWRWMVRKTELWILMRELQLKSKTTSWPVPFQSANVGSYEVRPLSTPYELWDEARGMHHCVDTYTAQCQNGESMILSIRKDGRRVATARFVRQESRWAFAQLRGFANSDPYPSAVALIPKATTLINQGMEPTVHVALPTQLPDPEPVVTGDLDELKRLFKIAYRIRVAPGESEAAVAAALELTDALSRFPGAFWYVWRLNGKFGWAASVQATDQLVIMLADGHAVDLKSGPYKSEDVAYAEMKQTLNATDDLDQAPPLQPGEVRWNDGDDGSHDYRPDAAKSIADVFWGEPGEKNHTQRFHLGVSPGNKFWVIWQEYRNGISGKSPRPWVLGHMLRAGASEKVAAAKLLLFAFRQELGEGMHRFDGVSVAALLAHRTVAKIASGAWTPDLVCVDLKRGDLDAPKVRPSTARLVTECQWTSARIHMAFVAYHLSTNRQHSHWYLWYSRYDHDACEWADASPVGRVSKSGLGPEQAAQLLIQARWFDDAVKQRLDRHDSVTSGGLLNVQELDAIADEAWNDNEQIFKE